MAESVKWSGRKMTKGRCPSPSPFRPPPCALEIRDSLFPLLFISSLALACFSDHPDLPPHSFIITPSASDLSTYLASHPESINTLDPYVRYLPPPAP